MQESERRQRAGEDETRPRVEVAAAPTDRSQDQGTAPTKRPNRLWTAGSVLVSGSGTVLAVLALPGNQLWIKLAVVAGNAIGTSLIACQPRG